MFNNKLSNIEKKALIITLANLSKNTAFSTFTSVYNRKLYKRVKIDNKTTQTSIQFNIDNYFKCDNILQTLLLQVFDEYNFVPLEISSDIDVLHNFSLLCNGITRIIKAELSSTKTLVRNFSTSLVSQFQNISDNCTLNLLADSKMSNSEQTCLVIVRHLIDNIISGFVFNDGMELLDFINGTRMIKDLLCLNATLYNEGTYFHFYQHSN